MDGDTHNFCDNLYPLATGPPTNTAEASTTNTATIGQPTYQFGALTGLSADQQDDLYRVFSELVEDEVSLSTDMIIASNAATGSLPRVLRRSDLCSWSAVKNVLGALAFSTQADNGWLTLGVPKGEGPIATIEVIERRARLGSLLTSVRQCQAWSAADAAIAQQFDERMTAARAKCIQELPQVTRARKNAWANLSQGGRNQTQTSWTSYMQGHATKVKQLG